MAGGSAPVKYANAESVKAANGNDGSGSLMFPSGPLTPPHFLYT
jgi:hypothetical protein